jgi:hypothetical protein
MTGGQAQLLLTPLRDDVHILGTYYQEFSDLVVCHAVWQEEVDPVPRLEFAQAKKR